MIQFTDNNNNKRKQKKTFMFLFSICETIKIKNNFKYTTEYTWKMASKV